MRYSQTKVYGATTQVAAPSVPLNDPGKRDFLNVGASLSTLAPRPMKPQRATRRAKAPRRPTTGSGECRAALNAAPLGRRRLSVDLVPGRCFCCGKTPAAWLAPHPGPRSEALKPPAAVVTMNRNHDRKPNSTRRLHMRRDPLPIGLAPCLLVRLAPYRGPTCGLGLTLAGAVFWRGLARPLFDRVTRTTPVAGHVFVPCLAGSHRALGLAQTPETTRPGWRAGSRGVRAAWSYGTRCVLLPLPAYDRISPHVSATSLRRPHRTPQRGPRRRPSRPAPGRRRRVLRDSRCRHQG